MIAWNSFRNRYHYFYHQLQNMNRTVLSETILYHLFQELV
jgi:hypothetical protein